MRLFTSERISKDDEKIVSYSNRLLHFAEMQWGKTRGFKTYDFGGIYLGHEDSKKASITKFKKSFGGVIVKYYNALPKKVLLKNKLIKLLLNMNILSLYPDLVNENNVYQLERKLEKYEEPENIDVHRSTPSGSKFLESYFKKIFKEYNLTQLNLLDVGCGEGTALQMFLNIGVKKISGVDLNNKALDIARANLKAKYPYLTIVQGNVIELLNERKYDIYYLYNPFPCNVFELFLNKIVNSKTDFYLLYVNCFCEDLIFATNKFIVIDRSSDIWGNNILCLKFTVKA
jgi:hypothetical protein